MKNKIITAFLLIMAGNLFSMGNSTTEEYADYSEFKDLYDLVEKGEPEYELVDVRTWEEYTDSHIPTAQNIPYDTIASNFPVTDKNALIVVYCRSGNRSGIARKTLVGLGYTNVHDFGAYSKWKDRFIKGGNPGTL